MKEPGSQFLPLVLAIPGVSNAEMVSARGMEVMRRRMTKLGQEPRTSDSAQKEKARLRGPTQEAGRKAVQARSAADSKSEGSKLKSRHRV